MANAEPTTSAHRVLFAALAGLLAALPGVGASRPTWLGSSQPASVLGVEGAPPRIAYLVKSDSEFYATRLRWVRESWANAVDPQLLLIVGDAPAEGVLGTGCAAHSHGSGLCCKFATALSYLVGQNGTAAKAYDWLVVVDDDAFVNVRGVRDALGAQRVAPGGSMLGVLGCGAPVLKNCTNGFCGGGGYALSREAAESLVRGAPGGPRGFLGEFEQACAQECGQFEDITVAHLGRRRGMQPAGLGGLHPWRLQGAELGKVGSCRPEPLTMHYLRSESDFKQARVYADWQANCTRAGDRPRPVDWPTAAALAELGDEGPEGTAGGRQVWMWTA